MTDKTYASLHRKTMQQPPWATGGSGNARPKIRIVFSAEHWRLVEPLVNKLRYDLSENYYLSALDIQTTQTESIYDIPLFIQHHYPRSDIVFAVGVCLEDSPSYEKRLVDVFTQRLANLASPGRLPVFDCVLVRKTEPHLRQIRVDLLPAIWAKRAVFTYLNIVYKNQ